jgi:GNAT superfamily N-acetyltransferase
VGTVHIRPAESSEYEALQRVEGLAGALFRAIGMDDIADHDPPSVAELAAAPALLVADLHGAPVGYARVELVDGHAHLEQLSVLPDHGGQGIGTALLDAVCDWARARGDEAVTLTTFRDVPFNAPLYAKRGFEELADADWSSGIVALLAAEAAHGLDPTRRVVMRRRVS